MTSESVQDYSGLFPDTRPRDRVGRIQPSNPFRDASTLFKIAPGLAQQFKRRVPDRFVEADGLNCACGDYVELRQNCVTACSEECGRMFLMLAVGEVLVAGSPS